ncbi:MAG: low temperature requirement protein A [Actinomycetes bacterium]
MSEQSGSRFVLAARSDDRVFPLELLLDVVFVFAISQTTELVIEEEPTWLSLASGLLMLALLWRGWTGFAWLTSALDPRNAVTRISIFVALGAFLLLAIAIPSAFHGMGLLFAGAYAVIRIIHVVLGWMASGGDVRFRATAGHNAIGGAVAVSLLVAGAIVHGPTQYVLWTLAVLADYLIPAGVGAIGWNLSASHFAERHALIIILALGESVLAIGLGTTHTGVSPESAALATVAVCLVVGLWSAYFDGTADAAEHRLASLPPGPRQNGMARFNYSLLHLVMFAADIVVSLGVFTALTEPTAPLSLVVSTAFFGGLAIYLLTLVLFRWRTTGDVNRRRLALAVVMVVLIPIGTLLSGWVSLMLAAALMVLLMVLQRTVLTPTTSTVAP